MTAIEKKQFIEAKLSQVSESVLDEVYILPSNSEVTLQFGNRKCCEKQSFEELLEQTSVQYKKVWEALA